MEEIIQKPRLPGLLDYFSEVRDTRQPWRVAHPPLEVLLLVVCGTIASCDDYEDIVEWGEAHIGFLRRFLPYYHGVPCPDWLRALMNRVDPDMFSACFMSWARELRPDAPDLIAIDGKTSRRSHDRKVGKQALHLISAFATNERLVLGQEAVADKSCEQAAIPTLLERLAASGALAGAVVTIDAIACNPTIAGAIVEAGADYVLAVKNNQPTLRREIEEFFATAPESEIEATVEVDKDHGRIETRRCIVSYNVDWMTSDRRFPGEHRFPKLTAIAMVEATVEKAGERSLERRFYIASLALTALYFAAAIRRHWAIGVSSEGHAVMSVKVRSEPKDSGFEAREAPWRESKTAEPSDNMLERSVREASGCNVQ
jgi:predicted transposase YbfD/YdcC